MIKISKIPEMYGKGLARMGSGSVSGGGGAKPNTLGNYGGRGNTSQKVSVGPGTNVTGRGSSISGPGAGSGANRDTINKNQNQSNQNRGSNLLTVPSPRTNGPNRPSV